VSVHNGQEVSALEEFGCVSLIVVYLHKHAVSLCPL